jgi:hypothetical protein
MKALVTLYLSGRVSPRFWRAGEIVLRRNPNFAGLKIFKN